VSSLRRPSMTRNILGPQAAWHTDSV